MPNFGFDFEGLEKQFEQLENFEEIAVKILNECVPILEKNVIKECGAHKRTADMMNSVKKTKVTKRQDGFGVVVRPTGKDRNGVRNMEKMAHAEYGTSKQSSTPILSKAITDSQEEITNRMQEIYNREVTKWQ